MTREEAIKKLEEYQRSDNPGVARCMAVYVLCDFLVSLGYKDIVEAWLQVDDKYIEFTLGATSS